MDMLPQQQSQEADMNGNLWEEKVLSIIAAGEEIEDILSGKDTASPPLSSDMSTIQSSSDAGQAPADDILAQAMAQELGVLSAQPTHGREASVQQDENADNPEPPAKPTHSREVLIQQDGNAANTSPPYMRMIAESIMESPMKRVVLSQVYSSIEQRYPKFTASKRCWKNSVRYHLSSNECFQKCGRVPSGRGYNWQIHPACMQMFQCGNFTREDAESEVHRYERENRMSGDGQQTRNAGENMPQQSIPHHHPQNSVGTTSAPLPQQYQQMQQAQVYVLPMPKVGPPSNTQGQYVNTPVQHVGTQSQYVSSQGQYVCIQGQYAGAQGLFIIPREQHVRNQAQG